MKRVPLLTCFLCAAVFLIAVTASADEKKDGWISLFDGKTLTGWKANEHPETWSVVDGAIVAKGPVSHLFYVGADGKTEFADFELKAEVRTAENTNTGLFFRTPWQDSGWLKVGFEAQLQNSGKNSCYTGGLWIHANREAASPVKDDEWFEVRVIAVGDKVTVKINDKVTVEYDGADEKRGWLKRPKSGLIALQGHGTTHRPQFRNLSIKPLAGGDRDTEVAPSSD